MATAYSTLYPHLRVILGDTDVSIQRWSNSVLDDAIEAALLQSADYSGDGTQINPSVADDDDLALILYRAAQILVNPQAGASSYRTRGLSVSRDGAAKRDILQFLDEKILIITEGGSVFSKDSSLLAFLEDALRTIDTVNEADI